MKIFKVLYFSVLSLLLVFFTEASTVYAQCAMCRAAVENSSEHDHSGLNMGILYLLVTPYILIGFVGYMWYKRKKQGNK